MMDCTEQFRTQILSVLSPEFSQEQLNKIANAMDKVLQGYRLSPTETALSVIEEGPPEMVKMYIASKTVEGKSKGTLDGYSLILTNFFRQVGKQPGEITASDIRLWMYSYKQQHKISDRTLEKYREYISRFFIWAKDEGLIQLNPAKNVLAVSYEYKPRQALTQLQMEQLRHVKKSIRDAAILEFLYSTGCRVSELCGCKISDVDFLTKRVALFGKGKKHRVSYLNARAEIALRAYLDSRDDSCGYLFVGERSPHRQLTTAAVEKVLRIISDKANIGIDVTPHIIRHTTATAMLGNGSDISTVSRLLGHANVATTMLYAETSDKDLRAAHERCVI